MASKPSGRAQPKYQEIAEVLRAKIDSGEYAIGAKLPTRSELMAQHGAALGTLERALEHLRRLGMIETYQGVGTFARKKSPEAGADDQRIIALEERTVATASQLDDLKAVVAELHEALIGIRREVQDQARLLARMRQRLDKSGLTLTDTDQQNVEAI